MTLTTKELEKIAWSPYDLIRNPTQEDWKKSYDALKQLAEENPQDGRYPNTLGYLCYYGRHTGQRNYEEARMWFEKGNELHEIESAYKLSDMLAEGLGGPADRDRAVKLRIMVYVFCRDEFEDGMRDGKFADTALRIGRMLHEGKLVPKNDLEAMSYLLEAKYAIECRKQYHEYGDETVEKNIQKVMDECEKPDDEVRSWKQFGVGLARVPDHLLWNDDLLMTIQMDVDDQGTIRLEFRRKRKDGRKPPKILWPVAPAMKVFMLDSVVLYGAEVKQIWSKTPEETVTCDRYEYDEDTETYTFFLDNEPQLRLQGGWFVLPMDELRKTEIASHPAGAPGVWQ